MIPAGRFVCRNISGYKTNLFKLIHFYMNGIGLVFFDLDSTPRAFLPVLDILVILLFFLSVQSRAGTKKCCYSKRYFIHKISF